MLVQVMSHCQVRLCWFRLGQVTSGYVKLGLVKRG